MAKYRNNFMDEKKFCIKNIKCYSALKLHNIVSNFINLVKYPFIFPDPARHSLSRHLYTGVHNIFFMFPSETKQRKEREGNKPFR